MARVSSSEPAQPLPGMEGPMTTTIDLTLHDLRAALAGLYDIEAPIARGGMALVYLARERRLDRPVAIKVLPPHLARHDASRTRFLREARTVAQLTHPNIVPIFTVDEIGGFVFFAMAYVAGETLAQRVARGPLDPHTSGRLLCDIGEALDYAHARGMVHRDVKPDNILIDGATGRALLSDFGIAHASPPSRSPGLLGRPAAPPGHVVGTAPFMSPEQASGDLVDARSDIYSLGVVAYYALSVSASNGRRTPTRGFWRSTSRMLLPRSPRSCRWCRPAWRRSWTAASRRSHGHATPTRRRWCGRSRKPWPLRQCRSPSGRS